MLMTKLKSSLNSRNTFLNILLNLYYLYKVLIHNLKNVLYHVIHKFLPVRFLLCLTRLVSPQNLIKQNPILYYLKDLQILLMWRLLLLCSNVQIQGGNYANLLLVRCLILLLLNLLGGSQKYVFRYLMTWIFLRMSCLIPCNSQRFRSLNCETFNAVLLLMLNCWKKKKQSVQKKKEK